MIRRFIAGWLRRLAFLAVWRACRFTHRLHDRLMDVAVALIPGIRP